MSITFRGSENVFKDVLLSYSAVFRTRANAIHFDVLFSCLPTASVTVTGTSRFQSVVLCQSTIRVPTMSTHRRGRRVFETDPFDMYRTLCSVTVCQRVFSYMVFTILGNRANSSRSTWTSSFVVVDPRNRLPILLWCTNKTSIFFTRNLWNKRKPQSWKPADGYFLSGKRIVMENKRIRVYGENLKEYRDGCR